MPRFTSTIHITEIEARQSMSTLNPSPRVTAYDAAVAQALDRLLSNDPSGALRALERAHVLGQRDFRRHLHVHWLMLRAAWRMLDRQEVAGQVLRLLLVPLGHLTRRLPRGNPGTTVVSAFVTCEVPVELARLLDIDRP